MPRPNIGRTINSEANLARRIQIEREVRGWSYEEVARRMTEAGCSIAGSAIFKIEKGEPRRRVAVDELIALGRVFQVPFDQLLVPVELAYEQQAREVVQQIEELQMTVQGVNYDIARLNRRLDDEPGLAAIVEAALGDDTWRIHLEVDTMGRA